MPYGFSMCGSIWALSFSAFSIWRSISRMDERYSSSLRRSVGPRSVSSLRVSSLTKSRMLRRYRFWRARAFGRQRHAVAEQAFKKRARVEHRRQGLRLALPGQIVGVGAGITGVAIAGLARIFHAQLERREAGLLAHLVGHDLVEGDAGLDIDDGLARLHAGEIRGAAAAVIARAIEQGAAGVVRQVAEQRDVLAVTAPAASGCAAAAEGAFVIRIPAVHDDAVGHVDERHAHGRFGSAWRRSAGPWRPGTAGRRRCPCRAGMCVWGELFW
jgi:hypothetical protein